MIVIHKTLLAHPGTQYSYQLARQLVRHKHLYQFWTGFGLARDSWYTHVLQTCLPLSLRKKIANRIIDGVPSQRLRTIPWLEWQALRQFRQGGLSEIVLHRRNQIFQEQIEAKSIQQSRVIIGFDTSSWILAERASQANKIFILDQSTTHPLAKATVLQEVSQRFPQWQEDLQSRAVNILNCEQQEYALADKIVVASSYTKKTFLEQGIAQDKIIINPYGVDLQKFCPSKYTNRERPLRFLFLGGVNARKGIPLLLQSWQSLQLMNAELWLVGPVKPSIRYLIPDLPGLKVMGKYPHENLPALLQQCDVLVFPSYFEGFALVLLEALASGLPIITTEATAGPDLISNGKEGFLIQSGDLEALCGAMQFFVDHPDKLSSMSAAARHCAERYSWNAYGDRWQQILQEFA